MDELRRLGDQLVADPPIARTPIADIERRASRRATVRRGAIVVVTLLVLAVGVGVLAHSGGGEAGLATQPGATLPPQQRGDLVIYLNPDAQAVAVQAVRDELLADDHVTAILYADQNDAYQDFACLFADQAELVQNVAPSILPSSFRLDIRGGAAAIDRIRGFYEGRPGVRSVVDPSRRGPSTDPESPGGTGLDQAVDEGHLGCPTAGTVIK